MCVTFFEILLQRLRKSRAASGRRKWKNNVHMLVLSHRMLKAHEKKDTHGGDELTVLERVEQMQEQMQEHMHELAHAASNLSIAQVQRGLQRGATMSLQEMNKGLESLKRSSGFWKEEDTDHLAPNKTRARIRWHLLLFLHQNPDLLAYRRFSDDKATA